MKDKGINLWLGTFGEGILKCRIQKSPFSSIGLEEMTAGNFQRMIYGLYQWPDGKLAAETGFHNFSVINKVVQYINTTEIVLDLILYITTGKKLNEISNVQQALDSKLYDKKILIPNQFILHDSLAIAVTSPSFTIFIKDTSFGSYYTTNAFDDGKFYWAASTRGLVRVVKKSLKDPGSFQCKFHLIRPSREGKPPRVIFDIPGCSSVSVQLNFTLIIPYSFLFLSEWHFLFFISMNTQLRKKK